MAPTTITDVDATLYAWFTLFAVTFVMWTALWNVRSASVHLWCAGNLLGAVAIAVFAGSQLYFELPSSLLVLLAGLLAPGAAFLKLLSLRRLLQVASFRRTILMLAVEHVVVTIAFALADEGQVYFWSYLTLIISVLMTLVAALSLQLGKRLGLFNATLLGVVQLVANLSGFAIAWVGFSSGTNPLLLTGEPTSLWLTGWNTFVSLCNSALFIGVVLDVFARRDGARQQLATRTEERERVIGDLHDTLSSRLAAARQQATRTRLTAGEVDRLLDDCMEELSIAADTMKNAGGSAADALRLLRNRLVERVAGTPVQLHWDLRLDDAPPMPHADVVHLVRLVQEAVADALARGRPRNIWLQALHVNGKGVCLSLKDDGTAAAETPIASDALRGRARELAATLEFRSLQPGTALEVVVPDWQPRAR